MLLFLVLGLGIIGLGIYAKIHSERMYKLGITKATVVGHSPAVKKIGETEIPCTEVIFEIPVEFGTVSKSVLDNGTYNVGDVVDIYYDAARDTVEFPKNISEKGSMGPYVLMGFGALIVAIILVAGVGSADSGMDSENGRNSYGPELNEEGYSVGFVTMPEDERYYEYYYMPAIADETYAYNVKIYASGVGIVTIFPMESNGKGLNQCFSFYLESEIVKSVVKEGKKYDFEELAGATQNAEVAEGKVEHEYLYYYDGEERVGSGGYGVESEEFDSFARMMKTVVPKSVWRAVKEEIRVYYE